MFGANSRGRNPGPPPPKLKITKGGNDNVSLEKGRHTRLAEATVAAAVMCHLGNRSHQGATLNMEEEMAKRSKKKWDVPSPETQLLGRIINAEYSELADSLFEYALGTVGAGLCVQIIDQFAKREGLETWEDRVRREVPSFPIEWGRFLMKEYQLEESDIMDSMAGFDQEAFPINGIDLVTGGLRRIYLECDKLTALAIYTDCEAMAKQLGEDLIELGGMAGSKATLQRLLRQLALKLSFEEARRIIRYAVAANDQFPFLGSFKGKPFEHAHSLLAQRGDQNDKA